MPSIPAQKDEKFLERNQFSNPIRCPKCGQTGMATWEENTLASERGPEPTLVSLSSEFYERVARKQPHSIELVCNRCGAVQPE